MNSFCNVCMSVCWGFDNCVGDLVICLLVFTVFRSVCTVCFIVSSMCEHIYSSFFCLY
jgi:hypothetical protein